MIYYLSQLLDPEAHTLLRLGHRYISSRAAMAFLLSMGIVLYLLPRTLRLFSERGWVNHQRSYMIDASSKEGVPVMGGIHIFIGACASMLLFCDLSNRYTQISLIASIYFFAMGFFDDIKKIKAKHHDSGMSRSVKYVLQIGFGVSLGLIMSSSYSPHHEILFSTVSFPGLKEPINISWLYPIFTTFVIVAISNAVNFADGMDGLATAPSFMTFLGLGIFAYILGNSIWSDHFLFFYFEDRGIFHIFSSECVVVCAAILGSLMGFLWYNTYPATIFMGDCGSMYLGGLMATMFILLKQELLFPIFGLLFLLEVGSVFIQDWLGIGVLGRRIMYRAPWHDYLKYKGYSEPKIVVRMWILSAAMMAIGMLSIKMR
jgi:phospho-N-acetylmuramoyl-pentapeptide-transferase